jgi:hypothetical protein
MEEASVEKDNLTMSDPDHSDLELEVLPILTLTPPTLPSSSTATATNQIEDNTSKESGRSDLWAHFKAITENEIKYAKCNYCST